MRIFVKDPDSNIWNDVTDDWSSADLAEVDPKDVIFAHTPDEDPTLWDPETYR